MRYIVGDDNFTSFAEKGLPLISNDNTMVERMTAAKEVAKERSKIQKQSGDPEKDRKQTKEREER